MKRNSFFGEIAILRRPHRHHHEEPLSTLKITAKDMFYRLVAEFPQMAVEVMRSWPVA
jgi:hypothetical protein